MGFCHRKRKGTQIDLHSTCPIESAVHDWNFFYNLLTLVAVAGYIHVVFLGLFICQSIRLSVTLSLHFIKFLGTTSWNFMKFCTLLHYMKTKLLQTSVGSFINVYPSERLRFTFQFQLFVTVTKSCKWGICVFPSHPCFSWSIIQGVMCIFHFFMTFINFPHVNHNCAVH